MSRKTEREQLVKRPDGKGTPCPPLLWFYIRSAGEKDYWPFELLRTIATSPTPFRQKNPDLKEALKALNLEWLKPSQISRIRVCLAPSYKLPRYRRQWFRPTGRYSDPAERAPRCQALFWAWRGDQKTCDEHLEYAAMFRVQKHRKGKKKRRDNLLQLKDARAELKHARRKRRKEKRQGEQIAQAAARGYTFSQQTASNVRADLWLLQSVRSDSIEDADSGRLEAMANCGWVMFDRESGTYKISGNGLQIIGEWKKRIYIGPWGTEEDEDMNYSDE
jgi:hypothetical protein